MWDSALASKRPSNTSGGQFQTNAIARDFQTPVSWVPAAKQKKALDLLIPALSPENLDVHPETRGRRPAATPARPGRPIGTPGAVDE
jgi:hypothetical protein